MADPNAASLVFDLRCGGTLGAFDVTDFTGRHTFSPANGVVYETPPVGGGYDLGLGFNGTDQSVLLLGNEIDFVFGGYAKESMFEFRVVFGTVTGKQPLFRRGDTIGMSWSFGVEDGYLILTCYGDDLGFTVVGSQLITANTLVTVAFSKYNPSGVTTLLALAVDGVVDTSLTTYSYPIANSNFDGAGFGVLTELARRIEWVDEFTNDEFYGEFYLDGMKVYSEAIFTTSDYTPYWDTCSAPALPIWWTSKVRVSEPGDTP
jgi:hypothetical protein